MRQNGYPNFLGIGVARSGTTWLNALLASHPEVYTPAVRKELDYFTVNFKRGEDWYREFFRDAHAIPGLVAAGEISPGLFTSNEAPARVAAHPGIERLIVMVRHPVDRLISSYLWGLRKRGVAEDLPAALAREPFRLEESRYARHLARWMEHMPAESILVLALEEHSAEPEAFLGRLGAFLGVDPTDFRPVEARQKGGNAGGIPRFAPAFAMVSRTRRWLLRHDFNAVVHWGNRIGIRKLFPGHKGKTQALLSHHLRQDDLAPLQTELLAEVADLEKLVGRPFAHLWPERRVVDGRLV